MNTHNQFFCRSESASLTQARLRASFQTAAKVMIALFLVGLAWYGFPATSRATTSTYRINKQLSSPSTPTIRVAEFNLDHENKKVTLTVMQQWGKTLFQQADIGLLAETGSRQAIATLASSAGMNYWATAAAAGDPTSTSAAIISRYPILSASAYALPDSTLFSPLYSNHKVVDATIAIQGQVYRVLATHFDNVGNASPALPSHIRSQEADFVVNLLKNERRPIIFGGDLNTCSIPPSPCRGSNGAGVEIAKLAPTLTDDFLETPGAQYCGDARVDYIFFRGGFHPATFSTDCTNNSPSDHPFLLATLNLPAYPDGTLLREQSSAPVYVIYGGAKFWISSIAEFNLLGYSWANVQVVPDGTLNAVPMTPADGTLLREVSSAPVYVVRGGQKLWIPDGTTFATCTYSWANVHVVPDGALAGIPATSWRSPCGV